MRLTRLIFILAVSFSLLIVAYASGLGSIDGLLDKAVEPEPIQQSIIFRYPESFKSDGHGLAEATPISSSKTPNFSGYELQTVLSLNKELEKNTTDEATLIRVLDPLINTDSYAPYLTPYLLRYAALGRNLNSGQQQILIRGLAANGLFDDAEKRANAMNLQCEESMQARNARQDILYFQLQKARLKNDLIGAANAFARTNDVDPNGRYQWRYDEAMSLVVSLFNRALKDGTFATHAPALDPLWPYLPHTNVRVCCDRLVKNGLTPTRAMEAAKDPLILGNAVPPAALIRRAKYSWSRIKNLPLAYEQEKAALSAARRQSDKRALLQALLSVADGSHQHGELEVEISAVTEALACAKELGMKGLIGEALLRYGSMQEQMADYKAALQTFQTVAIIVDETSDGYLESRNDQALSHAATHVSSPKDAEVMLRNNVERAEAAIRAGSTTGSRLIPGHGLGTNLLHQGRYEEAIAVLRRPLPAPDKDWCALLQIQIGRCYLKLGNGPRAEAEFAEAEKFEAAVQNAEMRWRGSMAKRMLVFCRETWLAACAL